MATQLPSKPRRLSTSSTSSLVTIDSETGDGYLTYLKGPNTRPDLPHCLSPPGEEGVRAREGAGVVPPKRTWGVQEGKKKGGGRPQLGGRGEVYFGGKRRKGGNKGSEGEGEKEKGGKGGWVVSFGSWKILRRSTIRSAQLNSPSLASGFLQATSDLPPPYEPSSGSSSPMTPASPPSSLGCYFSPH